MKLPAVFGKKKTVNLLPRDSFESSTLGVILEWAMATGKWAVIVTQLVVMGVFLWRWGLDRNLTNLRKEMAQQVAVIESYSQIEEQFLLTQKRVNFAKETIGREEEVTGLVRKIQQLTPSDVWYDRVTISPTTITMTANAASLPGFSRLLSALQEDSSFSTINVASIADGGSKGAQLSFDISLTYAEDKGREK